MAALEAAATQCQCYNLSVHKARRQSGVSNEFAEIDGWVWLEPGCPLPSEPLRPGPIDGIPYHSQLIRATCRPAPILRPLHTLPANLSHRDARLFIFRLSQIFI